MLHHHTSDPWRDWYPLTGRLLVPGKPIGQGILLESRQALMSKTVISHRKRSIMRHLDQSQKEGHHQTLAPKPHIPADSK